MGDTAGSCLSVSISCHPAPMTELAYKPVAHLMSVCVWRGTQKTHAGRLKRALMYSVICCLATHWLTDTLAFPCVSSRCTKFCWGVVGWSTDVGLVTGYLQTAWLWQAWTVCYFCNRSSSLGPVIQLTVSNPNNECKNADSIYLIVALAECFGTYLLSSQADEMLIGAALLMMAFWLLLACLVNWYKATWTVVVLDRQSNVFLSAPCLKILPRDFE